MDTLIMAAAESIKNSDALLITAGAGMGVDSGLPDFRGNEGFWNAYPVYDRLGLRFESLADPQWFIDDPTLAWGFYGHRLELYRSIMPHRGFDILKEWSDQRQSFIFTSNVDGQFQRAGFDQKKIVECHGSIHWLQCTYGCGIDMWKADGTNVTVDIETMRAVGELPVCPACGSLARPNILMFGDVGWDGSRTQEQLNRLRTWIDSLNGQKLTIIECGAGTVIPSVRRFSETAMRSGRGRLIRINVREDDVPSGQIGLALGAKDALERISRYRVNAERY